MKGAPMVIHVARSRSYEYKSATTKLSRGAFITRPKNTFLRRIVEKADRANGMSQGNWPRCIVIFLKPGTAHTVTTTAAAVIATTA